MNINQSKASAEKPEVAAEPLTFMRINRLESDIPFLGGKTEGPDVQSITVNDSVISSEDILAEAQHHPAENVTDAMNAAARALVIRELLTQQAARCGIDSTPTADATGKTETLEDARIDALLENEVDMPKASDADCERYYRLHPDKFSSDTLYEVRHILLSAHEDDKSKRATLITEAKELIDYLTQCPGEFASVALSRSDCPSREQGGNLGQIGKGSTVSEFESALLKLPVGRIAKSPIETRYGYHLIRVERVIHGELLPFDAVKGRIAAWLEASNWTRAMSQYVNILAGQADIKGFDLNGADSPLVQ